MIKVLTGVPVYKRSLNLYETISLDSIKSKLGEHDIFFFAPDGLVTDYLDEKDRMVYFDKHYFNDIDGYNQLLTSINFYSHFKEYDYILIAQLDTFIFKDELLKWCQKEYDYIGAPWMFEVSDFIHLRDYLPLFHKTRFLRILRILTRKKNLVGNGGLSLRKIKTFIEFLSAYPYKLLEYKETMSSWKDKGIDVAFNEDAFWALYVPTVYKDFSVAPFRDALKFSFETSPELCFKKNNGILPFGCHAWDKHGTDFWRRIFKELGKEI